MSLWRGGSGHSLTDGKEKNEHSGDFLSFKVFNCFAQYILQVVKEEEEGEATVSV